MKAPAIHYARNILSTPIWIDARISILSFFLLTALSLRPMDPIRFAAIVAPTVDTVKVFIPADSLTGYILDEMRKVETKLQTQGQAVDSDETNPFEVALFEVYRREGYKPESYLCPAGLETIGFGDVIDTQAEQIFRATGMPFSTARAKVYANVKSAADEINARFPGKYTKPNQWLALSLLGHSIGWGRLETKYPAFYKEIESGRPSARWLKYCRYIDGKSKKVKCSPNLERTRKVEWLLFNGEFSALHDYHVDAARVAKIRWAKGRADSLQRLGRE